MVTSRFGLLHGGEIPRVPCIRCGTFVTALGSTTASLHHKHLADEGIRIQSSNQRLCLDCWYVLTGRRADHGHIKTEGAVS